MCDSRRQDDAGGNEQEEPMSVEGVGRGNIVPIEALRRMHAARESEKAANVRPPGPAGGDEAGTAAPDAAEARLAAEARPRTEEERARLVDRFKNETADLPEVRRDKVIEAKLRISTGYYNRDEIRREVLRSILANLLPSPPPAGPSPADAPYDTPPEPAAKGALPSESPGQD
jgi:hypothetical protein